MTTHWMRRRTHNNHGTTSSRCLPPLLDHRTATLCGRRGASPVIDTHAPAVKKGEKGWGWPQRERPPLKTGSISSRAEQSSPVQFVQRPSLPTRPDGRNAAKPGMATCWSSAPMENLRQAGPRFVRSKRCAVGLPNTAGLCMEGRWANWGS